MLELIHSDCEQLLDSAKGTADLATHISSKVGVHTCPTRPLDGSRPLCTCTQTHTCTH